MKKFTSLLLMSLLALTTMTFVSCDDDDEIADTLWGVWEGDMYVSSYWDGQSYYSSYSEIAFDRNPNSYASGTGYWVDYYSNAPWDYYASHIRWSVDRGVITIYSVEDGETYSIYDYSLSQNYFSGTLDNGYDNPMSFRLTKTASPDWNDFNYGWGYWDDGYYAPGYAPSGSRSAGSSDKSSVKTDKPIRRIMARPETQK